MTPGIPRTPPATSLDAWIARRIGLAAGKALTRDALAAWQLARLNETLAHARARSPFFRERLAAAPERLGSLDELAALPFTTAEDLRTRGQDMLCVPGGEIARLITLPTSGTTGPPKRIGFTDSDLELTADFFHHGMSTFVEPGQRVLVLMPGGRPGTVGELLREGLARMGADCQAHGLVRDPAAALALIAEGEFDCVVGIPVQVLALARHPLAALGRRLSAVLLSADFVPESLSLAVEQAFACPVYAHWGMSETGLGGAVDCQARVGMHPRAADLLLEVVDPASGRALPDGEVGELVVTTLTRRGMPLVRYRTGDRARLVPDVCPCGSVLPRLDRVGGRIKDRAALPGGSLGLPELEEALFALSWLADFRASLRRERVGARLDLELHAGLSAQAPHETVARSDAERALHRVLKGFGGALRLGRVSLSPTPFFVDAPPKRSLRVVESAPESAFQEKPHDTPC